MDFIGVEELGCILEFIFELISCCDLIDYDSVSSHKEEIGEGIDGIDFCVEEIINLVEGLKEEAYFLITAA